MNKKTIALATAGIIAIGSVGVAGANYASQLDTTTALTEQLGGIAQQYKSESESKDSRISELQNRVNDLDSSNATAERDMQMTIQALRQQIQDLGATPCK